MVILREKKIFSVLFFTVIILFLVTSSAKSMTEDEVMAKAIALEKALREAEGNDSPGMLAQSQYEYNKGLDSLVAEEAQEKESKFTSDTYFRYVPSRKVKAMDGKVGLIDSGSEYSYEFKVFDKLPVGLSLDTQYVGIENTTEVNLPAHLTGMTWGLDVTLPFFNFQDTYLRLGVRPAFYTDHWNFNSSAFRIPSRYFLIYQPSERFTLVGGVAVFPDYRDKVSPIFGVIYKPNDIITFNLIPDNPNITYHLSEHVDLFAQGDITSDEYEVTRDDVKGVVLQYKEKYLGGGIKLKFNKYIETSISTGSAFGRRFQYRDSGGKVNIKSGLYTQFRLDIKL